MTSRRTLIKTALIASALPAPALAQVPATSKIIVGFAAGGGADLTARLLAEKMKDSLGGIQIIVENKTGAAGKLSVDALKASPPDGSAMLITPLITPVLSQLMFNNPGYDPGKDFTPIGMVGYFQFGLAVAPSHPAKNLPEFIAWLKANPGKANFGTPSAGSLPHFFGIMLGRAIGVDMQQIAYRGGAPMLADLMGGQITCGIDTEPELVQLHKSGKIRVLAMFSEKRTGVLPEVPTMIESGYKDAVGNAWYSLWAPAGTPSATISALNKALNIALTNADVKEKFRGWGTEAAPGTPADLERIRLSEIERWRPIVKASGFKAD